MLHRKCELNSDQSFVLLGFPELCQTSIQRRANYVNEENVLMFWLICRGIYVHLALQLSFSDINTRRNLQKNMISKYPSPLFFPIQTVTGCSSLIDFTLDIGRMLVLQVNFRGFSHLKCYILYYCTFLVYCTYLYVL